MAAGETDRRRRVAGSAAGETDHHDWGPESCFERLVAALEAHGCGPVRNGMVRCPAHDDRTPSLSIRQGDKGALLKCHAGCETEDVLRALGLGMRDLFDEPPERGRRTNGEARETPATYVYHDEKGRELFEVRRLPGKVFVQARIEADGRRVCEKGCMDGVRRVLYRLPAVIQAAAARDRVYIVEGEKDADAGWEAGLATTTNPGGAGKWRAEYTEALRGADVTIVQDRDEPGRKHAREVASSLRGVARSVEIREAAAGKDLADHLAAGLTVEALEPGAKLDAVGIASRGNGAAELDGFAPFDPLDEVMVPPFPVESLSGWLGDFVKAEAEATQTPPDLAGLLVLGAVATACAKKVRVQVRPGWREPVNVYIAVAQSPATRKSVVFSDVSAPLSEYERDIVAAARPAVARALEDVEIQKAGLARLRRDPKKMLDANERKAVQDLASVIAEQEAKVPALPRLLTDDCTPETLARLMAEQQERMSVWSPEGGELFEMMRGRYAGNARPNIGVYLQGHAGDRITVDRQRGRVHVESATLTIACAIQPAVIRGLRDEKTFKERGLLGRFVYALPPNTVGSRKWEADPVPAAVAEAYRKNLRHLLELPLVERALTLDADAYALLAAFDRELEPRLAENGDLGAMADWAGKLVGLVVRFAGLLHAARHADRPDLFAVTIDRGTMEGALELGRYALEHARAAFASMGADERTEGALKVWRFIARRALAEVPHQELWQGTKGGRIGSTDEFEAALGLLASRGYLRPTGGNGGGPRAFRVNPAALEHEGR